MMIATTIATTMATMMAARVAGVAAMMATTTGEGMTETAMVMGAAAMTDLCRSRSSA
jgi:hypothetical protein